MAKKSSLPKSYNKRRRDTNRVVVLAALAVAILGLGVAFAALSTTLFISGTAQIKSATWSIIWSNPSCQAAHEAALDKTTLPTNGYMITDGATSTVNTGAGAGQYFRVAGIFKAPDDAITCTIDAKNAGTINAKVDAAGLAHDFSGITNFDISLAYTTANTDTGNTTTAIKPDDTLKTGVSKNLTLIIKYTGPLVLTATAAQPFSFTLPYTQD